MPQPTSIKSSSFATDVAKLVTGTTFAQIITIFASPILTRLYSPEAFGFLALFISITGIIGVISCMRYELAIMLPKDDREAANLLGLCLTCVIIISGLIVPILFFFGDFLVSLLNAPGLAPYLILVPAFVFINGIFLALNYWNSRSRHYGRLSVARITSAIATTSTQLGAGFAGYSTGGSLIGASLLGSTISTCVLGGQIWKDDKRLLKGHTSLHEMIVGMRRYKKFPLIDSFSAIMNAVSWQLPVFLLAFFFSPSIVGFYALGFRILQLPMSMIGGAIGQVFFQRAANARSEGTLPIVVESVFNVLVVMGAFPIMIIALIGSEIFSVIFGPVWSEAGLYAQILSVWAFVWFISSPLSNLWAVLERQEFGFRVTFLNLITRLISLILGGISGDPLVALSLFSISGIFVYGYLNVKMLNFSNVDIRRALKSLVPSLAPLIPSGSLIIGLKWIGVESVILVISASILGVIYYNYVFRTNKIFKEIIQIKFPS